MFSRSSELGVKLKMTRQNLSKKFSILIFWTELKAFPGSDSINLSLLFQYFFQANLKHTRTLQNSLQSSPKNYIAQWWIIPQPGFYIFRSCHFTWENASFFQWRFLFFLFVRNLALLTEKVVWSKDQCKSELSHIQNNFTNARFNSER